MTTITRTRSSSEGQHLSELKLKKSSSVAAAQANGMAENGNKENEFELNHDGSHNGGIERQKATPRFETFMMTGDLILNLNTKTSTSFRRVKGNEIPSHTVQYDQAPSPFCPIRSSSLEEKSPSKPTKREAPLTQSFMSPVTEKKPAFTYSGSFVRNSKSEDHLQKDSITTVNIDFEDSMASSLNTLLDTRHENPANERIVWTYNAPQYSDKPSSPIRSPQWTPPPSPARSPLRGFRKRSLTTLENINAKSPIEESEAETQEDDDYVDTSPEDAALSPDMIIEYEELQNEEWVANIDTRETDLTDEEYVESLIFKGEEEDDYKSFKEENIEVLYISENGDQDMENYDHYINSKDDQMDSLQSNSLPLNIQMHEPNSRGEWRFDHNYRHMGTNYTKENSDNRQNSQLLDEDSDIESLHNFHYSPKANVDMPSAQRLAKRLYYLEGFKKSDVARHLSKNNDFSRVVAEEYLKYFVFSGDSLDTALRKFLKQFSLTGETQERERVLIHFSKRYLDCNHGSFNSQDAVHTLTCAIMLLNTDLHGQNIGKKMTCPEFIENLTDLNDGDNFPKDILKSLYHSIKSQPLEWAADDEEDGQGSQDHRKSSQQGNEPTYIGHNPFLEVPNVNNATEYKKGYVMRKCCMDPDGKRTPFGRRGWKMFYATLKDMVLYLHKDEQGFKKNTLYENLHNSIRIHHSLATKANDYKKKQHVFRLQTAENAEYLFQTSDSKELQSWIDTINFVAASLSAPPLAGGVGSQKKFQRPLLPVSHTRLNLREQLQDHERRVLMLEQELEEHRANPPDKGTKSRITHEFHEKDTYLIYELQRYKTYAYLLRSKLTQYPELEPSLVETCIGEDDELADKLEATEQTESIEADPKINATKRSISDRYSYRAAIYKTGPEEDLI